MTIPVIDLGDDHAATFIARACEDIGFLVVTNHGVDSLVIDEAWDAATTDFSISRWPTRWPSSCRTPDTRTAMRRCKASDWQRRSATTLHQI